ncbi:MAG: hypothetical protein AAF468_10800 [Pseudomonadota bacterium]
MIRATSVPQALSDHRMVRRLDGETIIYNTKTHMAVRLDERAEAIRQACDGKRSVQEIGRVLATPTLSTDAIECTIADLVSAGLVSYSEPHIANIDRRRMLKRAAKLGAQAALVPVVATISAPVAAQALSCGNPGDPCSTNSQCCSNICDGGFCEPF